MKKVFLSIFVGILFFGWINFGNAGYIGGKKGQELQEQARKNLKLLENSSGQCKKEISSLIEDCEKTYGSLHGLSCLHKMLSDGKAGPITLAVYLTEEKCVSNSMLNSKVFDRKQVIKNFCNKMSSYKRVLNNLNFINADKSIFLKILCNETGIYTTKQFAKNVKIKDSAKKYYGKLVKDAKKDSFINFGLFGKCKNTDGIVVNADGLNNVNFVCVANDIWNKLAEDEINMGSYVSYGGFTDIDGLKKWQSDFFKGPICDNYFNYDVDDKDYCKHEKTYRYLKQTQTSLNNILHNFNLFKGVDDIEKIQDIVLTKEDKKVCKENEGCQNFMSLKNSIYNELYFYTYFLSYYGEMVQNNTSNLQLKKVGTTIKSVDLSTAKEFLQAKKSIIVARLSLKKSFDLLKNIYWTYPIHVGFLAIIEDFTSLRDDLAKIYTPIDQLRYKLQNVQDLSKH